MIGKLLEQVVKIKLWLLFVFIIFITRNIFAQPTDINYIEFFRENPKSAQQLDTVTTFALEDFVYIKITAQLGGSLLNPQTTDTCVVRLTNLTTSEYIDVIFDRKIGSDTTSADSTYYFIREGLKNIQLKYIGLTNNDNNYLGAYYGHTISVSVLGGFTNTKNFTIVTPTEPASLNSLYIMNSSYTERIAETVRFTQGDIVYLQATAQQDAQLLTQDSLLVTVKNSDGTLMTVELLETGKNTGIYRSSEIQITNLTNPNQKTIEEIFGDSVWFEAKGKSDTLYFVVPKVPQQIYNAKFYYGGFTNLMSSQSYQKPLNFYVQVVAQDSEPYYIDTLPVIVQRASSNADSIIVILTETAKSSGLFRSPLITIGDITNQNTLTLRGEYGETIGLRISNTIYDTFLLSPNTSVEPAALTAFTLMTANYGTILPDFYKIVKGDRIYLQATAQTDLQPLVADTFLVNVKLNGTLIMTITMLETSLNSGIFRNSDIVIADNTDSSLKTVAETFGAPLTFEAKGLTDTVYFALPTTPLVNLGNAKFYNTLFTQSYSQQKFDKPLNLAIEINATDLEPYYVDTLSVIVQRRNSSVDSIALILTETSKSSGKFRSENFTIDNYTSQIQKRLRADYNDTVGLVINGVLHDTILINNASGPNMLYEIYFTNSAFTVKLLDNERVDINERLYIEASGDYGNSNLIDTFSVFVRNNRTGDSVSIVLTETSRNSGIYRNSEILIKELTSQYLKYLKANYYDSISILSNYNVSDTIYVVSPSSPTTIYDAFFQNEQFTDILSGRRLPLNTKLNVSLFSEDLEIKYNDTNTIYIRNTVNGDSVFVQAREISSGILRTLNFVTLGDYTNNTLFTLRAAEGDTINLIINNRIYDTIYLVTNNSNIVATSFNFLYSLDTSAIRSDTRFPPYSTVYIELNGIDNDAFSQNYVFVSVIDKFNQTITVRLNETGLNTGKYRGQFHLRSFTDQTNLYIYAFDEDDTIRVIYNGLTNLELQLVLKQRTSSGQIVSIRFKNQDYFEDYMSEYNFDDVVYIEAVGYDSNPYTVDIIEIECFAYTGVLPNPPSSEKRIYVRLTEIAKDAGIFRGTFSLKKLTNDTIDDLRVDYGDTIRVRVKEDNSVFDEKRVTIPVSPIYINELKFYTDGSFGEILPYYKQKDFYDVLYIQATGSDINPLNADTVGVILYDATLYRGEADTGAGLIIDIETYKLVVGNFVNLSLIETDKNTGIYRGQIGIGIDNVNSEELGKIIGTSRGNNILLFWENDFNLWHAQGRPIGADSQPILRSKVKMIEYDQPDYIREIQFMKDQTYTELLRTPHLTMQQSLENNLPYLKYIYVRAFADTMTASDLLEDTFDLVLKVYSLDENGNIIWDIANSDALDTLANEGRNSLKVVNIRMVEEGKNSGIYTNKNDVKAIIGYDATTQAPQSQDGQVIGINFSEAPYHLLVVEPTIRHGFNKDTALIGRKPPTSKADSTIIASDTSFIAFPIPPRIINRVRIFEDAKYINPLIPAERTYSPPFDRLYIKAEDSYDLAAEKFGEISLEIWSNDALKDEVYLHLRVWPFESKYFDWHNPTGEFYKEYGDSVLIVRLLETGPATNEYIIDPTRTPRLVTRLDINTPKHTNQSAQELHILKGDTITVRAWNDVLKKYVDTLHQDDTPYILFQSALNRFPRVRELKLMNATYTEEYTNNLLHNQNIYIQVYGSEGGGNPILVDTVPVKITNLTGGIYSDTLEFFLTETDVNSEIYRLSGAIFPKLDKEYTLVESKILKADTGQFILFEAFGQANTYFGLTKQVASPRKPTTIYSVKITKDYSGIYDYIGDEYRQFARGTTIYIELSADPGDTALIDNTGDDVYVENGRGQKIYVTLVEDNPSSGKYRGSFKITDLTNDTLDELGVLDNETFVVRTNADPTKFSTFAQVATPSPPRFISSIGLKNSSYSKTLLEETKNTVFNRQKLYVELNGQDANSNIVDRVDIYVISWANRNITSDTPAGWIKIPLIETGLNTGKYRGDVQLGDYNDTDQRMIKTSPNYLIAVIPVAIYEDTQSYLLKDGDILSKPPYRRIELSLAGGYADTAFVTMTSSPTQIYGITLKDESYTRHRIVNKENPMRYGEIIYVEAQGDIANDLLKDTTLVEVVGIDVNGSEMPATRLIIELVESDVKSGTYRGKFKIASDPYTQSQQARAFYEEDYYVQRISTAPKLAQDFAPILDAGVPISDPYLALFGPQNAAYFIIRSIISPAITYGDTNSAAIDASPIFNVFPNPWKRGNALYDFVEYKGTIRNGIRFTGLSNDATIKIYDIAGRLVFSSPCESGASQNLDYGQFLWTGINNDGKQVSSGIYIYTTRDRTGEIRKGKIAILK